ncbi:MAG: hypothetical protein WAV18_03465 [Roseiarcus sp.]
MAIDRGRREAREAAFHKAARAANGALRLAERYFVAALTSLKTVLI